MAWMASFRALPFMANYGRREHSSCYQVWGYSSAVPFPSDRSRFLARPLGAQRFSPSAAGLPPSSAPRAAGSERPAP